MCYFFLKHDIKIFKIIYLLCSDKSSRKVIILNNLNSCSLFVEAAEPLGLYAFSICFAFMYLSFKYFHLLIITATEQTSKIKTVNLVFHCNLRSIFLKISFIHNFQLQYIITIILLIVLMHLIDYIFPPTSL